jgi:ketosteroid isomerase-like protein
LEPPAAAVSDFLKAVCKGDDAKVATLLTTVARQKAVENDRIIAPAGSDTAQFALGEVEYRGEDGAWVHSTWSDLDTDGNRSTQRAIWLVRKEPEGWRIAGVAPFFFEGEPPLLLNFEDPEEMAQKQRWLREEMIRRAQTGESEAQTAKNSEESVRR